MPPFLNKRALVSQLLAQCNDRRLRLLNILEDTLPPLHEWPEHYIRLWLGTHLQHAGISVVKDGEVWQFTRWDFICGLLGQGMNPGLIADWVMAQPGYVRTSGSARDIAGIIEKHAKGELTHVRIYSMELRMMVQCETPSFAKDEAGMRIKEPVYNADGTPKMIGDQRVYRIDYSKPGKWYWQDAARRLKAYADTLPKENDGPEMPPPDYRVLDPAQLGEPSYPYLTQKRDPDDDVVTYRSGL